MKKLLIFLLIFSALIADVIIANESSLSLEIPLKPLAELLHNGELESLNAYLDNGGKWPKITTDSFAAKEKIVRQKELVALTDLLTQILKKRANAELPVDVKLLESDATLLFSLGEKLWKADGYRNRSLALLCSEFATYRCGKIAILTKGQNIGPTQPEVLNITNSSDMLTFFVWEIPEIASLSESGLSDKIKKEPMKGESWLEILESIRKIEIEGSTVGGKFNEVVSLQMEPIGTIISREDLSSLVFRQGWASVIHESLIPALALYLRNNGSLERLKNDPTNATKFKLIMKEGAYRYSTKPVMWGHVNGDQLESLVEGLQTSDGISKRLFGPDK